MKSGDLVPGDTVELEFRQNEWIITKLLPRTNWIFRTLQRESKNKILASNVDFMLLVFSMERPVFKRGLLDRYLLRSAQWGIPALILLNKSDIYDSAQTEIDWDFEFERVKDLCAGIFCLSAKAPEASTPLPLAKTFMQLETFLHKHTVIFMGQSGVGKSKLIQSLSHGEIETKSLSLGVVGKGVHTTSWTDLHVLKEFNLIDSPGIRSLSLSDIEQPDLMNLMPDLAKFFGQCKFHNCQHEEQAKGCYFWSDSASNITKSRFQSYLRFKEEIQSGKSWEKDEY